MIEIRHTGMDSTTATQQNYNQIFRVKGIRNLDSFYLWLISLLKASPGEKLLDISTGEGRLVALARRNGLCAVGVDFSTAALKEANKQDPQPWWIVGDGEALPIRNATYDYITHIGSLEHYQNPIAGISEISRVLKPGGIACILLPNSYGLLGNIWNVYKTGDIYDDGQPLQRYNTPQGWQRMLKASDLLPLYIYKYEREWPRTIKDLRWYLYHPAKIVRLFFSFFVPVNLGNCLVYLCKRAE